MSKLLFIGGTRFVGRAMVEACLAAGHEVSVFHRGQSGADLFPEAEHLLGDRELPLTLFEGRNWDAVVDVSGYTPSAVRRSVAALKDKAERYIFVSTLSVFSDRSTESITESSPLHSMPEGRENDETVDPETYGALKALCEKEVAVGFDERSLMFRPGLVMGPHDVTDRFTYWVRAGAMADSIGIPTTPDQPVQITDSRDLGAFMLKLIESGQTGLVNVTGPVKPLDFGEMWQIIQAVFSRTVGTVWEDSEAPGPMPCAKGFERFMRADCSKAISLGFKTRPMAETVRDTWAWDEGRGLPELKSAPSRFRKAE